MNCTWTAWGDMVCRGNAIHRRDTVVNRPNSRLVDNSREGFVVAPICRVDADCDTSSRCDNKNSDTTNWACKPCSDVGCAAGKACLDSSDCGEGLSCTNNVCAVGSTIVGDKNQVYNLNYNAYQHLGATTDDKVFDCAENGTCGIGYPCDGTSTNQCASMLTCDAGICKSSFGSACMSSDDCQSTSTCSNGLCVV